jgi:hypothetical protein
MKTPIKNIHSITQENAFPRCHANSRFSQPVKQFVCAASAALFCAAVSLPLQAALPLTPPTLYYATPGVVNNPFNWSTTSTDWDDQQNGSDPVQGWVNGDYAYFGVTGVTVPENITVAPAGIDTPGITVVNASSDFGLTQPTGSTITLDADPANTTPGGPWCTMNVQSRNLYLTTTLAGNVGLYLTGSPLNGCQIPLSGPANTYTGNTWVGQETTVQNLQSFGVGGTIMLEGGLVKLSNTAGGRSGTGHNTYWDPGFANPVRIDAAINNFGSAGNWITFAGPVNIAATGAQLVIGNIAVTMSGVVSGNDLNVINRSAQTCFNLLLNGTQPNTYSGGTTVSFNNSGLFSGHATLLEAATPGSLGKGNVTINVDGSPQTSPMLQMDCNTAMSPLAILNMSPDVAAYGGMVFLNYSGIQVISGLTLDGIALPPGFYGAGVGGDPGTAGFFTGPGLLQVSPQIQSETLVNNGTQLQICWQAVAGVQYQVQYTSSLYPTPIVWTQDAGSPVTPGSTGLYCYTLSASLVPGPLFVTVQAGNTP